MNCLLATLAAMALAGSLDAASSWLPSPLSSPLLPTASAAWFADDRTTTVPEFTGNGAGVMTLNGGAVALKYVTADGSYVWLPPTLSTSSVTAPYHASFNITGDMEIQCKAWLADWTPATAQYLFNRGTSNTVTQWWFRVNSATAGTLSLVQDDAGVSRSSDDPLGFTDGTTHWVRARADVGTNTTWDTSTDGTSWTDFSGIEADIGSATSQTTHGLVVGAHGSAGGGQWSGGIYRVRYYNGLVGSSETLVASFNADNFSDTNLNTCTDTIGHTWTINRPASGYQAMAVQRTMIVGDGTNDYMSVPDDADLDLGTGSWTVSLLVVAQNVSATRALVANKTGTGQGWALLISGTSVTGNASDGTDNITTAGSTISQGVVTLVSLIRDVNTLYVALDGTRGTGSDVTAVGSVTNANALHTLALNAAGSYADGVGWLGTTIHTSALSPAQCAALKIEMLAQTTTP